MQLHDSICLPSDSKCTQTDLRPLCSDVGSSGVDKFSDYYGHLWVRTNSPIDLKFPYTIWKCRTCGACKYSKPPCRFTFTLPCKFMVRYPNHARIGTHSFDYTSSSDLIGGHSKAMWICRRCGFTTYGSDSPGDDLYPVYNCDEYLVISVLSEWLRLTINTSGRRLRRVRTGASRTGYASVVSTVLPPVGPQRTLTVNLGAMNM